MFSPQTPPEPLIDALEFLIKAMKDHLKDDLDKQHWHWKMYWEYRRMNEEGVKILKELEEAKCRIQSNISKD